MKNTIFSAIKLAIQAGNPNPVLLSNIWTLLFDSYEDGVATVKDNFTKKNYFVITKNGNKEYALTEAAFIKMLSIINPSLIEEYNDSTIEEEDDEIYHPIQVKEKQKEVVSNEFNTEAWVAKNTKNGVVSSKVLSHEFMLNDRKEYLKYLEFFYANPVKSFDTEAWIAKHTKNGVLSKEVLCQELLEEDEEKYLELTKQLYNKPWKK
jgi:hypothetical protein